MIPCFDNVGRSILASPSRLAWAADGHGGLHRALWKEGILADMERRRVKYLHVYCVDNILVKVADPVFMGYVIKAEAESANNMVEKAFPEEAVGYVCKFDGNVQVGRQNGHCKHFEYIAYCTTANLAKGAIFS